MRRGRFFTALAVVAALTLYAAATTLAAGSRAIYNDAADGKLSRSYSRADLQAATKDATVEGYGGVQQQTMRPVVARAAATQVCVGLRQNGTKIMAPANASNTGANAHACANVKGAQFTKTNVAPAGTLPFTGLRIWVFAALGLSLLAGGLLLRRASRD